MAIRNTLKILGLGLLAGVVAFAACDDRGTAPASTGSIVGEVTMDGRGLDGVTASLSNGTTATTASDGSFRFDGVVPGTYDVSISGYPVHAAFGTRTMPVTVGGEGGVATVVFGATNSDRDALVALYDSAGGAAWTRNDNWLTTAPLGDWYGVTTNANGRVTALGLFGNNLRGTIPAAIGGLTQLNVLALFREPGLTGPIPRELGNLADLRLLALGGNDLTGAIPPEIGNLTELTSLYLWGNRLTGAIPPEIGNLVKLQALQLDGRDTTLAAARANPSTGTGRSLSADLPGLSVSIHFHESGDDIPVAAEIAASRGDAGLTGSIPAEIGRLTNLTLLTLAHNRLTGGIPAEIGDLTRLDTLSVRNNQLTGGIPAALGRLTDLSLLAIDRNQLIGRIPVEIGNLRDLRVLWAGNNALSGSIPTEVGSLGRLTHLGLHENSLTGTVPAVIGNLTSLVQLTLSRNQLRGTIPAELGNLANLEVLYLNQNSLNGGIPAELGALDSLVSLSLRDNELTGAIPPEIGDLSKLEQLWVQSNPLSGPLPLALTNLANLSVFNFSATGLCVPDDQAFVSWLQSVGDVTGSGLDCGTIASDRAALVALYNATDGPNWTNNTNWLTDAPLSQWNGVSVDAQGRVTDLYLYNNGLRGVIPPELGDLVSLESLDFGINNLRGAIPSELGRLAALKRLSLHDNLLTDSIPPELGDLSGLEDLNLPGNLLRGEIPPELGKLASLQRLALGRNNLSGEIPSEIGDLTNLRLLFLTSSGLTGALPASFLNLSLDLFWWEATTLCAPNTPAFQTWLAGIGDHRPGPYCTSDRDALEALYNSTDGPNWTNNTNWLTDAPLGDWYGVTADAAERVTGLDLDDNNLTGTIPPQLGDLTSLETLFLVDDSLSGPIPEELGNLADLRKLVLAGSGLNGQIPAGLGNLSQLDTLVLVETSLTGAVPSELGSLSQLELLALEDNLLTGAIPESFLGLDRLKTLSIAGNNGLCFPATDAFLSWLGGIEDVEGELCVTEMDRSVLVAFYEATGGPSWKNNENWLTDLPLDEWYGVDADRADRVWAIDHSDNNLIGSIPSQLGKLAWLVDLDLSDNQLTGPLPSEFGDLSQLLALNLQYNQLTGPIPPELGNLSKLELLGLLGNEFTGEIPDSFLQLQRLKVFTASVPNCVPATPAFTAWLEGIPEHFAELCTVADRLALMRLYEATDGPNWTNSTNWLTDAPIGDWHGVKTDSSGRATRLQLGGNNLTGALPYQLGNLANLTVLDLSDNDLSGTIPGQLGNLGDLNTLALGRNNLNGAVPPEFGDLANLAQLYLRDNPLLSGPLPVSLAGLRLEVFWYFNTDLCVPADPALRAWLGGIPDHNGPGADCVPERDVLMELYNSAGGTGWARSDNWGTNAALSDWYGVTVDNGGRVSALHLPRNNLSGAIPATLGRLGALRTLALHQNDLTGPIPAELVNLANLGDLNLWGNRLSGSIPPELGNLRSLWQLSLAFNELTGPIPPELWIFC